MQPEGKRSPRKEKILLVAHVMTGVLLITKGLHKLSEGHATPLLLALTPVEDLFQQVTTEPGGHHTQPDVVSQPTPRPFLNNPYHR